MAFTDIERSTCQGLHLLHALLTGKAEFNCIA